MKNGYWGGKFWADSRKERRKREMKVMVNEINFYFPFPFLISLKKGKNWERLRTGKGSIKIHHHSQSFPILY